jgi:hypothetical protein
MRERLFVSSASGFQLREGEFWLRAGGFCLRASEIWLAAGGSGMRVSGIRMAEGVAGVWAGLFLPVRPDAPVGGALAASSARAIFTNSSWEKTGRPTPLAPRFVPSTHPTNLILACSPHPNQSRRAGFNPPNLVLPLKLLPGSAARPQSDRAPLRSNALRLLRPT